MSTANKPKGKGAPRMVRTQHPGIYKRGSRYVVVWRHRGQQHKEFFRTLAEAREAKGRRQAGERTPQTRVSFEEYALQWLDTYRGRTSRGLGDLTREDYRRSITNYAIPFFRRYRLSEVEPPDVRRFIDFLEGRGLKAGSVRKAVAPLRAMFATAFEDGALRSNPTVGVRVSGQVAAEHEDDDRPRALTRAQLTTLLDAVPSEWRLFFELLAHTGFRISEAIGLTWADVKFGERPRIELRSQLVRGKRRRLKSRYGRRDIPLSPGMARKLWDHRAHSRYRKDNDPVFASTTGTALHASNVRRRVLAPAAADAGVSWAGFHTFRHTCASLLFAGGKNVKQVQEWLGHHDAGFTLRTYVHLMDEGLGDASFLDAAVGNYRATEEAQTGANAVGAVGAHTGLAEPQAQAEASAVPSS